MFAALLALLLVIRLFTARSRPGERAVWLLALLSSPGHDPPPSAAWTGRDPALASWPFLLAALGLLSWAVPRIGVVVSRRAAARLWRAAPWPARAGQTDLAAERLVLGSLLRQCYR